MSGQVPQIELVKVGADEMQVIRSADRGWLVLKQACEKLGIDSQAQQRRLERSSWAVTVMMAATGTDGKSYQMFCLRSDRVAMWLATIDTSRLANDEAREKLELWQCQAADVLDRWVRCAPSEVSKPVLVDPALVEQKLNIIGDMVADMGRRLAGIRHPVELEFDGIKLKLASVEDAVHAVRQIQMVRGAAPQTWTDGAPQQTATRQALNLYMLKASKRGVGWQGRRDSWTKLYDTLAERGFNARALRGRDQSLIAVLEEHGRIDWAFAVAQELFPLPPGVASE